MNNGKGAYIAKQIVSAKMRGQNILLEKHNLEPHNEEAILSKIGKLDSLDLIKIQRKLSTLEGHFTKPYFQQIFELLPEKLRPEKRSKFKAYDGVNNAFNLAYTLLKWRVHKAILGAKLEPYLGFVHSEQHGKPSLVCDLMELYRYLVDDFVVQFCQGLKEKDFVMKGERTTRKRWGKREYLNASKTRELERGIDELFGGIVEVPRIRHGLRQSLETLINEEALVLAKYLRDERKTWVPRLAI